jgi:beta-glucosidase
LLKGELNFQGSIMSDWGGVWATEESIVGGLDWEMPGINFGGALGTFFDGRAENLFQNGTVGTDRLDDMIARILTPYYFLGQDTTPLPITAVKPWGPTESALAPYRLVQEASTVDLVKKIAEDGTVLLKNENNTLPLQAPARIAIIGSKAGPLPQGFENCANTGVPCETPSMGGGSGWSLPLNYMDPLAAIRERAAKDRTYVDAVLNDTDYAGIAVAAANADVAMVFVHAWAAEGVDREPSITLNYTSLVGEPHLYAGEALVNAVAAVNPNTVVSTASNRAVKRI